MVLSMKIYILSFFYSVIVLSVLGLSSACYDVVLRYFICAWAIQTDKMDLISQIYQIMVVMSILKSWNRRHSSHYSNLNIVSSCMISCYLYLESIDLLQI